MKGLSSPLNSTAILPSPVLLWRFKVLLFIVWGFSCCKIGWDSVMRMNTELRDLFLYEAFLYYNPLLLVTMMVWLWGICLWVFFQANVGYAKIFDLDPNHLTHREIWKCATWMTIIVPTSMTAYLYLYSHGEVLLAAFQPILLYAAIAMILMFPFDIFYLSSRYYLLRTIWRIVFPLQAITFADFFLADIFTSMSKVFSDLERSVCRMVHRQVATVAWFEADSVCGSHSVAIPIVLVLPYIFRLFQCLRQYKDTKERTALLNAFKYSTAVPVIFLSALKYHVFPNKWTDIYRPLWLLSSMLNSLYSFYWDITRDWDLSCFTRVFKFSRPHFLSHLLYGRTWVKQYLPSASVCVLKNEFDIWIGYRDFPALMSVLCFCFCYCSSIECSPYFMHRLDFPYFGLEDLFSFKNSATLAATDLHPVLRTKIHLMECFPVPKITNLLYDEIPGFDLDLINVSSIFVKLLLVLGIRRFTFG